MRKLLYLLPLLSLPFFFSACKGQKELVSNNQTEAVKGEISTAGEPVQMEAKSQSDSSDGLDLANSLLWKIEGKGMEKPSYLYGTIHLIDSKDFFWPQNSKESFDISERIVFEIDLDDMFDMGNIMGMMTKAFMKDGMTIKDLLSEEDYKLVNDHFADMGLPMFMMEKLKPMFLTVFAEGDIQPGAMEDDGGMKSYEMEFYELAQQAEKDVAGLETMDDQISLFDSIPYSTQAEMLVETIKASSGESNELEMLTKIYKDQNIVEMVKAVEAEDSEFAGYEDLFLNNRNKNWIPLMENYMKEGVTFFAVGAGHLAGREGVINLLKQAGYKLSPMSEAKPSDD